MLDLESAQSEPKNIQDLINYIPVPLCFQETEYTCGVACVQSILARYGMYCRQSALAEILQSRPIVGTDFKSIMYLAQLLGLNASMKENMKAEDIENIINSGITPILIIQAWRTEDDIDYSFDWKNAHYIIACGYYEGGIYVMDPNTLGNYTYLPYSQLYKRWHAVDYNGIRHARSGLILDYENCPIKYNPSVIKYLP